MTIKTAISRACMPLAVLALLFAMSCTSPSERLAERVNQLSDSIPKEIARGLCVQGIEYDGSNLILTYAVDEDYYDVGSIAENLNPATIEEIVTAHFGDADGKLIYDSKSNIICVFTGSYGNECKFLIDPRDHNSRLLTE